MARSSHPVPPTISLPPLSRLHACSTDQIEQALLNLHTIYRSKALLDLPAKGKTLPKHSIHDLSVPDSGYASADEDNGQDAPDDEDEQDRLDILRSDAFERNFVIRWLTAFAARSDGWVYDPTLPQEEEARAELVDNAASLLASFAGDNEEVALTRTFAFPRGTDADGGRGELVGVELNDAPLLSEDHTSVGLQSWASSIILAEQMCLSPASFGLSPSVGQKLRILELGAGTGLLSIAAAKLLHSPDVEIVATDYHALVLQNLKANAATNFPLTSRGRSPISVFPLDWQTPVFDAPLDQSFDVILAADVIYHPDHAKWIKNCVEQLLARSLGIFWLIIPVRSTGRHEGMGDTVEAVFPRIRAGATKQITDLQEAMKLAILSARRMGRHNGVGRADESGYTLFEIGWAPSSLL